MALRLNRHLYDPHAILLFTFDQLVNAIPPAASRLIGEHVRLQSKLLPDESAQEELRTSSNPEVAVDYQRCA
jgi:hypothetical protein